MCVCVYIYIYIHMMYIDKRPSPDCAASKNPPHFGWAASQAKPL